MTAAVPIPSAQGPREAFVPHGPVEGCRWCAAGTEAETLRLGADTFGLLPGAAGTSNPERILFPRAAWGSHLTRSRLAQVLGFVEATLDMSWTARFAPENDAASHFHVRLRQGLEPFRAFIRESRIPLALPVQRGHASAGLVRGQAGLGAVLVKAATARDAVELAWDLVEHLLTENVPHEAYAWNEETGIVLGLVTHVPEEVLEPLYRHGVRGAATAQRREGQRAFAERLRAGPRPWVAMGDIDKLQCLNRLHGRRLVGDESHGMIRRLFERLDAVARRDGACFFRYLSGDEFGVISRPGATASEFGQTLEAMRESARALEEELAVLRVTGVEGFEQDVGGLPSVAAWLSEPDRGVRLLVWKRPEAGAEQTRNEWERWLRARHGASVTVRADPFQQGVLWAPTLSMGAAPAPDGRDDAPQERFAEAMALATSLCKQAKTRRDCIVLVEHPPTDVAPADGESAILRPPARDLLRWLHAEGALPVPRELKDPVTGLSCQEALEGELLGLGLGPAETFLQLTDSAYTSERFVEQEHRPIKWGPEHRGTRMGARIMAVNEFYGFDAGSEAIQLVAAAVLRHLRPGWRERVRVARAPPDKVQLWLSVPASRSEVLAFLDDVQQEMNDALLPGLTVRIKAVCIRGEHVSRGAEVLDMVDPLRSLEETVDVDVSPREQREPGRGNVLATHDIPGSDLERRRAFQAASARFLEEQAREAADELLRVYRDRRHASRRQLPGGPPEPMAWTVVVGGRHGAGKNTLALRLASALGLRAFNVGDLKRRMAAVRGFTSVQRYGASLDAGAARELDAFLDGLQEERILQGGALLHSFFGPWVVSRLEPELDRRGGRVLRILLECPLEERARRVHARHAEGDASGSLEEVREQLAARDAADLANFARIAGDAAAEALLQPERYDLILDTSRLSADDVAARALEQLSADPPVLRRQA